MATASKQSVLNRHNISVHNLFKESISDIVTGQQLLQPGKMLQFCHMTTSCYGVLIMKSSIRGITCIRLVLASDGAGCFTINKANLSQLGPTLFDRPPWEVDKVTSNLVSSAG